MTDWIPIGRADGFREGRGRVVVARGVKVAVFRVGTALHAMRDACPHMGLSLAEAEPENGRVTCHGHEWTFDLETGRSDRRSGACARIYDVRVEGGEVFVRPRSEPAAVEDDGEPWVRWDDERHARSRPEPSDRSPDGEERRGEADEDPGRGDDGRGS